MAVPYTTADARQQLLNTLADAADELGGALASLSEAYEQLDEQTADTLEQELFRPVQMAYGRAKRTHAEFAERHGLPTRSFVSAVPGAPNKRVKGFLDSAVEAVGNADRTLATLQDSMLPVEVGDEQLRAGLEAVRELVDHVRTRAREIERTLGR
jgi:ABC-type transporter Mla subunit MlaD